MKTKIIIIVMLGMLCSYIPAISQCSTAIPITGNFACQENSVPGGWTKINSPDFSIVTQWCIQNPLSHYVNGVATTVSAPPDNSTTFLSASEFLNEVAFTTFTVTVPNSELTVYLGGFSTDAIVGGPPTSFTVDAQDVHLLLNGVRINGTGTIANDGNWHPVVFSNLAAGTYTFRFDPGAGAVGNANAVHLSVGPNSLCAPSCTAGTNAPTLSTTTLSNTCPTTTANLTSITASNMPANTTLTWHTGTPATNANKLSNASAVGQGTYFAAFYDATNDCYSDSGNGTTAVTVTITSCCSAGTNSPTLSTTSINNVCPTPTVNLTSITASNMPANTTLTWHTGTPATNANVVPNATAVFTGIYHAAFYDATNNCYSNNGNGTTSVLVTTTSCCNAGTNSPTLSATSITNVCPANTVDLTTITASNMPANTTLTWHSNTPATTANLVANPNAASVPATYYAAFYDATNNCYSNNGNGTTAVVATLTAGCCDAGTNAPTLSTTSISNVCPTPSVDLTSITASNMPANTTLTWHSGTPATTANLLGSPNAVGVAGTYYAAFYDATNNCYSDGGNGTTSVTVTITSCCSAGIIPPDLASNTLNNVCPANTADLTSITASNMPPNTTLTWHTSISPGASNLYATPTMATEGLYYGAFYDAVNDCYSDAGTPVANSIAFVIVNIDSCCQAGVDAPILSTTSINNCPGSTVDLTSITASNMPANTTLTWHTSTPATTANLVANPNMVGVAGTYFAAFYYATDDCYSDEGDGTTAVTVTINSSCCAAGDVAPILIKN